MIAMPFISVGVVFVMVVVFEEDLAFLALLKFAKKLLNKFQEGTAARTAVGCFI